MAVTNTKDLFDKILLIELENAQDIAVIKERCSILKDLEADIRSLRKELTAYEIATNTKIADAIKEQEKSAVDFDNKTKRSTSLITFIGAVIAILTSFLIAHFTRR